MPSCRNFLLCCQTFDTFPKAQAYHLRVRSWFTKFSPCSCTNVWLRQQGWGKIYCIQSKISAYAYIIYGLIFNLRLFLRDPSPRWNMTARPMCAYFQGALIIGVRLFLSVYSSLRLPRGAHFEYKQLSHLHRGEHILVQAIIAFAVNNDHSLKIRDDTVLLNFERYCPDRCNVNFIY